MRSSWSPNLAQNVALIVALIPLAACGPDLRIERVLAPETACPGEDIGPVTSVTVQNLAEEGVDIVTQVGWYLSSDELLDDGDDLLIGGRDQAPPIPALSSVEVGADVNQVPDTATSGDQFLMVVVDETDEVEERDEANNVLALPITIGGAACGEGGPETAQLAAGGRQTCALSTDGRVRCWGMGEFGVLGYGNVANIGDDESPSSAGDVPIGGSAIEVATGFYHTCALLDTGDVRCWGRNEDGQLGLGHTRNIGDDELPSSEPPVDVGGTVVQLTGGVYHTCALLDTGAVRCWGDALFGQLGYGNSDVIGDNEAPSTAGDVALGRPAVAIEAGDFHTCAVLDNDDVICWGGSSFGQLGTLVSMSVGDNETPASVGPVTVGGPVVETALGSSHTCALLDTGAVRCWGAGDRLGYGTTDNIGDNETPASVGDVPVGALVDQVSAGGEHTCALTTAGTVRCWGYVVGSGVGYASTTPVTRPDVAGDVDVGGTVAQLASGYGQICAVMDTGAVRCWGNGNNGLLGYGNTDPIGDDETPATAGDLSIW